MPSDRPASDSRDTRVHVFLGKGGVGKTTCSAATALQLAERGEPSLVISTDPTPSLSHIFEVDGVHRDREIRPGLYMMELGLDDVRRMWDEKFGRDVYGVFSSFVDVDYDTFVRFVTSVTGEPPQLRAAIPRLRRPETRSRGGHGAEASRPCEHAAHAGMVEESHQRGC